MMNDLRVEVGETFLGEQLPHVMEIVDIGRTIVWTMDTETGEITLYDLDTMKTNPEFSRIVLPEEDEETDEFEEDEIPMSWIELRFGKRLRWWPSRTGWKNGREYFTLEFMDGTTGDYHINFGDQTLEEC